MSDAKITLGREGMRFVAGGLRMVVPRHCILGFIRAGDSLAKLMYRTADPDSESGETINEAEFKDTAEAQAIEDWLLDGMPGVMVPAEAVQQAVEPKIKPGQEIGPGSIVEYLGRIYEVSREAHDGEIRKWRLGGGFMGRGVNESALRLVTPIRKGDKVIIQGSMESGVVIGPGYIGNYGAIGFPVRVDSDAREDTWYDQEILHASRDTDYGVVVVR